jgi:hypothetical protein
MGEVEVDGRILREPRNLVVLVRCRVGGITNPFGNDPHLHIEGLGGQTEVTVISGYPDIDADLLPKFSHESRLG